MVLRFPAKKLRLQVKKHFESHQKQIDVINRKCHDIKHQIAALENMHEFCFHGGGNDAEMYVWSSVHDGRCHGRGPYNEYRGQRKDTCPDGQ